MKTLLKSSIFCLVLCLFQLSMFSQNTYVIRDLAMWNNFTLSKDITKRLELNVSAQFRFRHNISQMETAFTEFGAEYKLLKDLKIGAEYRLYRSINYAGEIEFEKRLRGILQYNYDIKRFEMAYRLSFQNKKDITLDDGIISDDNYNLRNKISFAYNIKKCKLNPELSFELFRKYEEDLNPQFNKYRLAIGGSYPIYKHTKLEIAYKFDKELNVSYPMSRHIISTSLKYSF